MSRRNRAARRFGSGRRGLALLLLAAACAGSGAAAQAGTVTEQELAEPAAGLPLGAELAAASFRPPASIRRNGRLPPEPCRPPRVNDPFQCILLTRLEAVIASIPASESAGGKRIAGRVLSAAGHGIPGVTLIAWRIGAGARQTADRLELDPSAPPARYRAVSGAGGAYAFEDLPAGEYSIRSYRHDEFASLRITVSAGEQSADLVLLAD